MRNAYAYFLSRKQIFDLSQKRHSEFNQRLFHASLNFFGPFLLLKMKCHIIILFNSSGVLRLSVIRLFCFLFCFRYVAIVYNCVTAKISHGGL